jgi:hypothetical protein
MAENRKIVPTAEQRLQLPVMFGNRERTAELARHRGKGLGECDLKTMLPDWPTQQPYG